MLALLHSARQIRHVTLYGLCWTRVVKWHKCPRMPSPTREERNVASDTQTHICMIDAENDGTPIYCVVHLLHKVHTHRLAALVCVTQLHT